MTLTEPAASATAGRSCGAFKERAMDIFSKLKYLPTFTDFETDLKNTEQAHKEYREQLFKELNAEAEQGIGADFVAVGDLLRKAMNIYAAGQN